MISLWCHHGGEAFGPVGLAPGLRLIMNRGAHSQFCCLIVIQPGIKNFCRGNGSATLLLSEAPVPGDVGRKRREREGGKVIAGSIPLSILPSGCIARFSWACLPRGSIHHGPCVLAITQEEERA